MWFYQGDMLNLIEVHWYTTFCCIFMALQNEGKFFAPFFNGFGFLPGPPSSSACPLGITTVVCHFLLSGLGDLLNQRPSNW